MDDDVGAVGQRLLQIRARRRCCRRPAARRWSCARAASAGDVGDAEQRVGRRLHPDDLRAAGRIAARTASTSEILAAVHVQTPALGDLGEETEGAAVRVVRDHDMIAGLADRTQQGVLGGEPAGEGEPAPAALQRGEALLQRVAGRVGGAARTRTPRAATRRRPGRTWTSGRSAAPPRRCAARAPARRGWPASRSRRSLPEAIALYGQRRGGVPVLLPRSREPLPVVVGVRRRPSRRSPSSTTGRCSRVTCWSLPTRARRHARRPAVRPTSARSSSTCSGSPSRSRRVSAPGGTFVALNNRVSQSVPHLHAHVVPRTKGDGLRGFFWPRTKYASPEEAALVRRPDRRRAL